jgi:hypothetical protein
MSCSHKNPNWFLSVIETLYFYCYYAYLLGDLTNARIYYEILREEFKASQKNALQPHQYAELKKIKEALASGNISRNKWLDEPIMVSPELPTVDIKQKELVKKIHFQGLDKLKNILQDDVYLYNLEMPCPPYGFVDMVYMGEKTVYPIEVKKDQGKHDLIGQICKYDLFHRLHLHQKRYEFVKSLTICHSYHGHVTRELKQLNIVPLHYAIEGNGLALNIV